jgi:anti-anti-sigma factor
MRDRLAEVSFSEVRADAIVASVSGEIDGSNAAELRRAIAERVPSTARSLIMDLTSTTYIDSTGVELLFELARRLSARRQIFTVVVPRSSGIRKVLELCDIGSVAVLVESQGEGVEAADAV